MPVRPNFFIIGAPKCGTTALSEYLGQHPRVGFSNPKEPIYFATDFPRVRHFQDEATYLEACFRHCADRDPIAVGEGTTCYFFSLEAVRNILRFDPRAKFILMVRNPYEMIPALHAQKLLSLEEDVSDFELAWALQAQRAQGQRVPRHCQEPRLLMYAEMGQLGGHIARHFAEIPADQRLLIVYDDFAADPRAVYERVLAFLGVPSDGRADFPRVNPSQAVLAPSLYRFGHRPPKALMSLVFGVKKLLRIERLGVLSRLLALTVKSAPRPGLSPAMLATLRTRFDADIDRLAGLIGRDLSHWKA